MLTFYLNIKLRTIRPTIILEVNYPMENISHFSIEKHNGPYEKWPLKSKLFHSDKDTGIKIPGFSLLHQFKLGNEFLLITDWDCPFEEATEILLLDSSFRIISHKRLSCWYYSWLLDSIEYIDENQFLLFFMEVPYKLTILPFRSRWLSRFRLEKIKN